MLKHLLYLILLVLFAGNCFAQTTQPDSALLHKQTESARHLFKKTVAEQSKIYNGAAYKFYDVTYSGSPYFMHNKHTGTVMFNNVLYKDMSLMYDMFKDVLVLQHYNGYSQIALYSPRVQSFDIAGHHFVYFDENAGNGQLKSGYYDELYNGKPALFGKRETLTSDSISNNIMVKKFYQTSTYYVKQNGKFYKVKSRGDIVGVLKDKKKELEKYIKSSNLNFSDDRERSLTMTVAYYNQISK